VDGRLLRFQFRVTDPDHIDERGHDRIVHKLTHPSPVAFPGQVEERFNLARRYNPLPAFEGGFAGDGVEFQQADFAVLHEGSGRVKAAQQEGAGAG
jgi:hypothetical protein